MLICYVGGGARRLTPETGQSRRNLARQFDLRQTQTQLPLVGLSIDEGALFLWAVCAWSYAPVIGSLDWTAHRELKGGEV